MQINVLFWSICIVFDHIIFTERDLTFLRVIVTLWYGYKKALELKQVLCSGEDDEYSFCGALKGGKCEMQEV